jgi:ribosomal protein S18 acetylase RimI-like enzyme
MDIDVVVDRSDEHIDAAAEIWAQATAARDGGVDVAPLSVSRPVIEAVVTSSPRSLLLVAVGEDGSAVGFAAAEPVADGQGQAELRYLGVRPDAWGSGVAGRLLSVLRDQLKAAGFVTAQLYAYVDNPRASGAYRRAGWAPCGAPRRHPRSGRPEQRYMLSLAERGFPSAR